MALQPLVMGLSLDEHMCHNVAEQSRDLHPVLRGICTVSQAKRNRRKGWEEGCERRSRGYLLDIVAVLSAKWLIIADCGSFMLRYLGGWPGAG